MFPGLDLYYPVLDTHCADPAQPLTNTGEEIYYLLSKCGLSEACDFKPRADANLDSTVKHLQHMGPCICRREMLCNSHSILYKTHSTGRRFDVLQDSCGIQLPLDKHLLANRAIQISPRKTPP